MLFSGIPFLYYFIPAVVILYFLLPAAMRNGFLLLSSLLFYAWGEPRYVILMVATIVAFWGFGLAIEKSGRKKDDHQKDHYREKVHQGKERD